MKILVVIDAQADFVTGVLGSADAQATIPNISKKLNHAFENNDMIVFTQDTHEDNYMETSEGVFLPTPHCIKGTPGWELVDLPVVATCIEKPTFGCYTLPQQLINMANDNIDEIELCGFCTDICVISNALILKSVFAPKNIDIVVDASACAGTTPDRHRAALEVMKSCQIIVKE